MKKMFLLPVIFALLLSCNTTTPEYGIIRLEAVGLPSGSFELRAYIDGAQVKVFDYPTGGTESWDMVLEVGTYSVHFEEWNINPLPGSSTEIRGPEEIQVLAGMVTIADAGSFPITGP